MLGTGGGQFSTPVAFPAGTNPQSEVIVADSDGDSRKEIVSGLLFSGEEQRELAFQNASDVHNFTEIGSTSVDGIRADVRLGLRHGDWGLSPTSVGCRRSDEL